MPAHNAIITPAHEGHKNASLYPRVVSHTQTTAFMVAPATSVQAVSTQSPSTSLGSVFSAASTFKSHLSVPSPSASFGQLSYLADPHAACSPQSTAFVKQPAHRHYDVQSSPHTAEISARGQGAHSTSKEENDGDHHYRERQRCNAAPSREEVVRNPYDGSSCGFSKGTPTRRRLDENRSRENCFDPRSAAPIWSACVQAISDRHSPLSEKTANSRRHIRRLQTLPFNAPARGDGGEEQRGGLRQRPAGGNSSRWVGFADPPAHTASSSSAHSIQQEKASYTLPLGSVSAVPLVAREITARSSRRHPTNSTCASTRAQGTATKPVARLKKHTPRVQQQCRLDDADGQKRFPQSPTYRRSPLLKDPQSHDAPASVVCGGGEHQGAHPAAREHQGDAQHIISVKERTAYEASPMHNDTFHRTERHTTVPIPAEILSSTPSPVHLFENDASATTSTTSAHAEERDLHYPTTCSALDVTGVSALSPSPQKCSPLHEEVRRRLGKIELTPDDFLATSSPPPGKAHRLRAGYPFGEPQAENAACSSIGDSHSGLPRRSPAALRSGNPTSVSGDVPAPLSLSVSPPLRGRLPFDAAAGEDEVEERDQPAHVPSSSSALNSSSLGQPFDSVLVSPLPTESVTTPPTQELIFLHCRRVLQEELAAREWIEVDASVHLHHLACEERVGYRVAEAVQYYRRLQDASLHPMFNGITPADLITPPTRKQRNSEEGTPRAGASDSTASPTSPLSCVQRRRRMPSANSLPPLSPCRKTPPAEEEMRNGCVSEETDAGNGVSPPSSPGACSLSSSQEQACDSAKEGGSGVAAKRLDNHSSSRSPVKVEEDEPNGDSFVTRGTPADAAGASDSCAAGEDPDKVLYGSDDSGDWEDASETENANKEDEQQEDGDGASTSQMEFGDALALPDCEADATQCSAVDTVDASVKPPLYSPASRESDEAANTPASARRPSPLRRILNRTAHSICLLRDVQSDEEDARYLLTGNCPPPHVFQRWADRFLREQQHTAAQTTGGGEEERRHEKGSTPSPDASEPTIHTTEVQSAAKRGMGVLEIDLCMDSQSDRRSLESPATAREVSRRKDVPEKPLAAMASEASASCDGDRSTSRQRQCSERYRDGVLRSFCADLDDGGHAVWPSGERDSSRLREVDGADVDREYNATGRYAPDPQFFDEDGCLLRSPSSLRSSSALLNDASPTLLFPSDMAGPSAANVTALPESTSTDALPVTDAETLAASFSAPPAAAFAPLTYPSEETYDAPCGSERNAWQMLMDDFIEGLVKLMRDEV